MLFYNKQFNIRNGGSLEGTRLLFSLLAEEGIKDFKNLHNYILVHKFTCKINKTTVNLEKINVLRTYLLILHLRKISISQF